MMYLIILSTIFCLILLVSAFLKIDFFKQYIILKILNLQIRNCQMAQIVSKLLQATTITLKKFHVPNCFFSFVTKFYFLNFVNFLNKI